jgi:hypothetical protein
LARQDVVTVIREIHAEALSHARRTARQSMLGQGNYPRLLLSASPRHVGAFYHVSASNQTPVRLARLPNDDVDRVMQPVREVAVEVTGWTKQGSVSVGHAAIGVCPGIPFAGVRFDLRDADRDRRVGISALEYTTKKGRRNLKNVASKETVTRETQSVQVTHRVIVSASRWAASSDERLDALPEVCAGPRLLALNASPVRSRLTID